LKKYFITLDFFNGGTDPKPNYNFQIGVKKNERTTSINRVKIKTD